LDEAFNARKKTDCCFSADHRTYRGTLGDGIYRLFGWHTGSDT
jgi:hypothetical protein